MSEGGVSTLIVPLLIMAMAMSVRGLLKFLSRRNLIKIMARNYLADSRGILRMMIASR